MIEDSEASAEFQVEPGERCLLIEGDAWAGRLEGLRQGKEAGRMGSRDQGRHQVITTEFVDHRIQNATAYTHFICIIKVFLHPN